MKKIFLFLTISLFSIPAMYAVVTWDGTSSEMWTQGTGTESDPFLIETPANLAYLSAQVKGGELYTGKYFLQTDDFDLQSKTWTSIGTTSTYKFEGNYDGGNKTISNLKQPLFGYINNATIQNLTIQGEDLNIVLNSSNSAITACMVGCTLGKCQLTNCHNKIKLVISYNYGSVNTKDGYVGGLVGCAKGDELEMIQCSNAATFSFQKRSDDDGVTYYGGLLGGASSGEVYIDQCYNIASSKSPNSAARSASLAGNLSGASNILMQRSYSKGDAAMAFILYGGGAIKGCYHIGNINNNYYSGGYRITAITANAIKSNCYVVLSNYSSQESWGNKTTFCFQTGGDLENGTYLSNEQMKQSSFLPMLNTLGDYFTMDLEGINDGYPILKWQAGPRYTITGSCDANRGTVKGGGEYAPGNTATLTATPKKGCTFVGWSDGVTDNPRSVTVEGDATYIAQFTKSNYTIYVNQDCTNYIE